MNIYIWISLGIFALLVIWFYSKYKKILSTMNSKPSEKLVILTDSNFKAKTGRGVVLVDFWADWCQPCKILGPVISEVADEMSENAIIAKLDVQNNPKTSQELGIRNIPTVMIFKNGKIVDKIVGVKQKKVYIKTIQDAIDK